MLKCFENLITAIERSASFYGAFYFFDLYSCFKTGHFLAWWGGSDSGMAPKNWLRARAASIKFKNEKLEFSRRFSIPGFYKRKISKTDSSTFPYTRCTTKISTKFF